jgi:hypothetical protein
LRSGRPLPPRRFQVPFPVRGWVHLTTTVRLQGLDQLKSAATRSAILKPLKAAPDVEARLCRMYGHHEGGRPGSVLCATWLERDATRLHSRRARFACRQGHRLSCRQCRDMPLPAVCLPTVDAVTPPRGYTQAQPLQAP